MNKNVLITASLIASLSGHAQQDSSYTTTYYVQKVTLFRMIRDTENGEVIFLGDSITDIAEWGDLLKDPMVKNRGINGDITAGVLARLDEVTSRKPSKIFIMIGINDIAAGVADSVILSNYRQIIDRIQKATPRTKIYIQSILPTNNSFTEFARHQNKDGHIRWINGQLQQLAKDREATFIDLYHLMVNNEGKLDPRYTNDGLHLKGEGYRVWIQELKQKKYL
ncbi:MAG: GDSL-type esterase/lipase family protein [Flavisolibacter sp.]